MAIPFFNKAQADASWSLKYLERPWAEDRVPILQFVRNLPSPSSADGPATLPDEEWLTDMRGIRFVPGLFDRVMRVHDAPEGATQQASEILLAWRALTERSSNQNLSRLSDAITSRRMSESLVAYQELVAQERFARPERTRAIARLLLEESPDRDAAKVALLVLAAVGAAPEEAELAMQVGRHGEFTRFAAPVVCGRVEGWERFIWEMARATPGYGRSAAIQYLEGVTDPEIKHWLLYEGWRESDYDESAAFICATTGGLDAALQDGRVTLEAAGGLLQSLARAGFFHHRGLRELPNGPEILAHFIAEMAASEQALWQFDIARSLHLFVGSRHARWEEDLSPEWPAELRASIAGACARILRLPGWDEMVWRDLQDPDERMRHGAYMVAHLRKIDLWDYWWRVAQTDPEFSEWSRLTVHLNGARVDGFLALASERLKPAPGQNFGGLGSIASAMSGFPGKGWDFVHAAIWSENGVSSIGGLRTLGEWGAENWTAEMSAELKRASERHPEAHIREFAGEILRGEWQPPERIEFDEEPEVWET